jgi:hypothetical protein
VHAQSHAEALLSTATSPQVYRAVLEQMEQEMQCGEGRAPRACGGRSARGSAAGVEPNGSTGKRPVVYQNGHEYHLQPDGSYQ